MGSLTACVKKAGSALKTEDKAAIMAAARENRKAGMSASEAGRKAVESRLAEVRAMITSAAAAPKEAAQASAPRQEQTAPEQRRDNTGDMFGGTSAEDLQAAAKREREKGATRQQGPDLFDAPAESAPAKPADRQAEQPASRIDDVGEKIGGARKDTAESTGPRRSSASEDDRPAWARRFKVSQIVRPGGQINAVRDEGRWVIRDSRSTDWTGQPRQVGRDTFATKEEAEAFVPIAAVGLKHRAVPVSGDKYEIWRDITDRKRVKVLDRKFDTRDEAMAYMAAHAVEIIETNTTFGEADLPLPPDRARRGPPRRDGNVKGEDFKGAFGFRAVEFGLWNNQDERQALMNDAWDGLMDLADVLGVPPRALGLNGDLALAFGARGHGLQSARAHYENDRAVINLTKEKGAGSLAHEFFHGLDHYFGRQDGKASAKWDVQPDGTRTLNANGAEDDFLSGGNSGNRSGVRPELRAAYEALLQTMTKKAERYVEDMAKVDKFTGVAREELAQKLDALRRELSAQKDPTYYKRNNKPASAELLAEFDAIAAKMVAGEMLTTDWRTFAKGTERRAQLATRWTNDSLERLNAIYKEVRGRSGFDTTTREGVLGKLRGYMERYSQRLKMLADAQAGGEKTRMVPTEFAMNARELDQGRGGDYWTSPHEMAARAFQGYVEDKIAEKGGVSRFLNYGPENVGIPTPWGFKRPFPAGAERKAINAAFDKFIGALQTREDDAGNVAMFSRATPSKEAKNALDALRQNDTLFAYKRGTGDTLAEVARAIDPNLRVIENGRSGTITRYTLVMPDGKNTASIRVRENQEGAKHEEGYYGFSTEDATPGTGYAVRPGKNPDALGTRPDVILDVSLFTSGEGGGLAYAVAADYAHSIGGVFIGDPSSLSPQAVIRRTDQMLSSALKWGSTDHIAPHPRQLVGLPNADVPPLAWDYANPLANIRSMIDVSLATAENAGSDVFDFDPSNGQFLDSASNPIDRDGIGLAARAGVGRRSGAGRNTLARLAVLRSLVRAAGGRERGAQWRPNAVLEELLRLADSAPEATEKLFTSRAGERQQGLTLPALQRFVQALSDAGIAGINAAYSVGDLPADKRDAVLLRAPDGSIRGAYFKSDDSVWLFAKHLTSAKKVGFVVMHEAFHRGLARELGGMAKAVLRNMHDTNLSLRRATRAQMTAHNIDLDEAIEEALADMAGQGKARDLKGFDRLMRLIRKYLAKVGEALGIEITWTDDMVEDFVAGIRRSGLRDGAHVAQAEVAPMLSRAGTAATLDNLRQTKLPGGYILADLMKSSGKVSWWSRTVGTMHHLAEREPLFKPVYDAAQRFLEDVSKYATEAADLAPHLLPKLETLRDITKSPLSAEDTKAISAPIFEGTLSWVRNEKGQPVKIETAQKTAAGLSAEDKGRAMLRSGAISENVLKMWQGLPLEQYEAAIETRYQSQMLRPGVVWTDAELKAMFRLSEAQIGLYREALKSANQSLSHLAASDMVRFAGRDAETIRDAVMRAKTLDEAHDLLVQHLIRVRDADPDRADVINDTINRLADKAERAKDLMARGYYPLMRFGKYTVDVLDADGERLYFGMFETEREANKMARALAAEFPKAKISQGTMSQQQYQMFAGVSPETLELFSDMLGLEATGDRAMDKAFQEFIKLTKSNRSAMKRLIERKGIAGFSEDAGRVLASFVYSNARQTSKNLHFGQMTDAVMAVADEKGEGELLDSAVRLHKYVANPQEEAQALRGLLFVQFLGGSIAAGLVNLTQPVMVTLPYLTQWGGVTKAALRMRKALADAVKWETGTKTTGNAKLDAAIKDAEERGIISPQEVHSLIAQAGGAGALKSGDGTTVGDMLAHVSNAKSKLMLAWGKPFSVAEQFNRRATFIAAWRTAVEESIDNPTAFAEKAIDDTQFTYNKGNRPEWARGAIGGTLFTFKTFSISYVELMTRMAKSGPEGRRAAAVGLAMLILASGLQGVPGADDLDDIIDGLMQRLGYNWSSKQKKREALAAMFGEDIGDFVMRGVSGLPGAPIDVAGRLGLGNLIPGTGLLTKKTDYGRDVAEIVGPFGALAQQVGTAGSKIVEGEFGAALKAIMPVAGQNIAQAVDMASMGMYRDRDGKKVIDADAADAIFKAIGFQPRDVAKVQNAAREQQGLIALNKMRETEIADKWARGIFEGDRDMVAEAQGELKAWNADNSESPIRIQTQQIVKRVQAMRMTRAERLEKTAPREIRASVRRELEAVQ